MLCDVSACQLYTVQFVSDRDVYTFLFVLLRGALSPCIVYGVVDLRCNRSNKSVQILQFWSSPSLAFQLFSQTVILSEPENEQENHDMVFKQ